jgi:hypothetical protein
MILHDNLLRYGASAQNTAAALALAAIKVKPPASREAKRLALPPASLLSSNAVQDEVETSLHLR